MTRSEKGRSLVFRGQHQIRQPLRSSFVVHRGCFFDRLKEFSSLRGQFLRHPVEELDAFGRLGQVVLELVGILQPDQRRLDAEAMDLVEHLLERGPWPVPQGTSCPSAVNSFRSWGWIVIRRSPQGADTFNGIDAGPEASSPCRGRPQSACSGPCTLRGCSPASSRRVIVRDRGCGGPG